MSKNKQHLTRNIEGRKKIQLYVDRVPIEPTIFEDSFFETSDQSNNNNPHSISITKKERPGFFDRISRDLLNNWVTWVVVIIASAIGFVITTNNNIEKINQIIIFQEKNFQTFRQDTNEKLNLITDQISKQNNLIIENDKKDLQQNLNIDDLQNKYQELKTQAKTLSP
jgi:hypothetical protein